MGRRKKTLHDYAAEFSELSVKQQLLERGAGGEAAVVETLYCTSCQLPMRVRRDRILEHLSSGRHYRNRRLLRQHALRAPLLRSAGPAAGLPPLPAPPFVLAAGCGAGPSPPALPKAPVPPRPAAGVAVPGEDPTPSTSAGRPSPLAAFHPRLAPAPPAPPGPRGAAPEAPGSAVGLALFGAGLATEGLCRSLLEEVACRLLYVVEDRPEEAERALGAELRAGTRLLRPPDADVALSDPRVSGAIVCSPPEEASEIVIGALRAGKAVFCERLPSLDRQTAEACFDEADRCGRPLVCGFYKRFDPALQFLHRKVQGSRALGRIHRVSAVSSACPAAPPGVLAAAGGIFYNAAVHDIDIISLLLGERTPDTVFSLGHAFCADLARVKDADTVAVSMKFPSGAVVTLDVSQHCTKSCDQRLEVRGSEGTLRVDNRHPLGITEQGTSVPICSQTQADRYRDAHRELLRHFLRTLKGEEPPAVGREQVLCAMRVAAAAEQAWRSGRAVELHGGAEAP